MQGGGDRTRCLAAASFLTAIFAAAGAAAEPVVIDGDHSISAALTVLDDDMTVNGTLTLAAGSQIDLNGHKLYVRKLAGADAANGTYNYVLNNPSFEELSSYPSGYKYFDATCEPEYWTYGNGTGVDKGRTWKQVDAPDGSYVCFLQGNSATMETTVTVPESGCYLLSFKYANRYNNPSTGSNTITPFINGAEMPGAFPYVSSVSTYNAYVALRAGDNTLKFTHKNQCSWIDSVSIVRAGRSSIFDSSADATAPGELHFHINSTDGNGWTSFTAADVRLAGNMKLVKSGTGNFLIYKSSSYSVSTDTSTFTGGTVVEEGLMRIDYANNTGSDLSKGYDNFRPFGIRRRDMITVMPGGVFDVGGQWCYRTSIVLAGGTLRNSGYAHSHGYDNTHGYGASVLTADSTNEIFIAQSGAGVADDRKASKFGSSNSDDDWYSLNLGGHELTNKINNDRDLYLLYRYITNGTFKTVNGTGRLRPYASAINMRNATLDIDCGLNMTQTIDVENYISRYTGTDNAGTSALNVYGTFKAVPGAKYYGCTMQDGSRIDVSDWSAAMPLAGGFSAGETTVKCPSGTVTVHTGERAIAASDKLIEWTSIPAATFALSCDGQSAAERELTVFKDTDGLYVKSTAVPDFATWDVENSSWRFWRENGDELTGIYEGDVPTSEMSVRFSTYAEYAAIKAVSGGISPAYYKLTGLEFEEGTSTFDMSSGLDFAFDAGTTIDVKGNTLKLPNSMIGGTVAFTVTSSVAGGTLVVDVPAETTVANTAVSFAGQLKLIKTGAGTFASRRAQTYTGGTQVAAGTAQPFDGDGGTGNNEDASKWFGTGKIIVEEGAVFDTRAIHSFRDRIDLAGGTLANTCADQTGPWRAGSGIGSVISKTSYINAARSMVLGDHGSSHFGKPGINLGGQRLECTIAQGKTLFITSNWMTNGVFASTGDGWLQFDTRNYNTAAGANIEMRTATLEAGTALSVPTPVHITDYTALYTGADNGATTAALNVYGTFKPVGAGFYGPVMQSGSKIDFAEWTGAWPVASSAAAGSKTIKFAAGTAENPSTFEINVSPVSAALKAHAVAGGYLLEWDGGTQPANAEFTLDDGAAAAGYTLEADETGLKLCPRKGFTIRIAALERDLYIPSVWVAENLLLDFDSDAAAVAEEALKIGANGLPKWQSYCLGLEPANADSVVLCEAADGEAAAGVVNVRVKNVSVPDDLAHFTVRAYLERKTGDSDWQSVASKTIAPGAAVISGEMAEASSLDLFRVRIGIE